MPPTRQDLEAGLDAIDVAKTARDQTMANSVAKTAALAQAKTDADQAATDATAKAGDLASTIATFNQMLADYAAAPLPATLRGMTARTNTAVPGHK